jgi:hypothetical protein
MSEALEIPEDDPEAADAALRSAWRQSEDYGKFVKEWGPAPIEGKNGKDALAAIQSHDAAQQQNILHWEDYIGREPPAIRWIIPHWLGWSPTLLAGRGGIGKSLLAQQIGTALACGLPTWSDALVEPLRVLYWACEDDSEHLWRRQDCICRHHGISMDALTLFFVDARYGLENTLCASHFGALTWTNLYDFLFEQVNDLRADVLLLENIGQ